MMRSQSLSSVYSTMTTSQSLVVLLILCSSLCPSSHARGVSETVTSTTAAAAAAEAAATATAAITTTPQPPLPTATTATTTQEAVKAVADCADGFYGFKCEKECSPNCASVHCHDITGECVDGCLVGWNGGLCDHACKVGSFGVNCTSFCSENCVGGVCDHVTGKCYKGCEKGFLGDHCDRVCREGRWGENCARECSRNCATPQCHFQSGYCLKGCKKDFWGAECGIFGNIRDVPVELRGQFYNHLSPESRSVLLYLLMAQYESTLEDAKKRVKTGLTLRTELRQLLAGRGDRRRS